MLSLNDSKLESEIIDFGANVFNLISIDKPTAFNKEFWNAKILEWAMLWPKFKVNLFRLIDVLPTLRSDKEIAEHISLYLADEAFKITPIAGLLFKSQSLPILRNISSYITKQSVRQMAYDVIAGSNTLESIEKLQKIRDDGLAFTVDLLGEYSVSENEAINYTNRYLEVLDSLQSEIKNLGKHAPIVENHPTDSSAICISVKLSALYSQISVLNEERSIQVLSERLSKIVMKAQSINAQVYCDAEDTGFNPVIYKTFKYVFGEIFPSVQFPGMVVQAYSKTSKDIILDLIEFAKKRGSPIAIRLVKGAYWDSETINAAQNGWDSPLFEYKESSDAQFEALTRLLMDNQSVTFPAIASHNIRSLSHACMYAKEKGLSEKDFELQMLYGMAAPIAKAFSSLGYLVRLYTPIGEILPGMGYLVRRLLENTSNESFLRHTFYDQTNTEILLKKPQMRN